jgi:hypothetical protein
MPSESLAWTVAAAGQFKNRDPTLIDASADEPFNRGMAW